MLNNICESFNSTIDSMRDKAIVTILKRLMVYLMKKNSKKNAFGREMGWRTWSENVCHCTEVEV